MIKLFRPLWLACVCLLASTVCAQQAAPLALDTLQALAKRHHPLVRQHRLIEATQVYSLEAIDKGRLPQVMVAGQATYQSATTQIPADLPIPGVTPLSRDQYRLYAEVSQPITDLFLTKDHRALLEASTQVEGQRVEVELYRLRERINQLFFGILLIDSQLEQVALTEADLQNGLEKINVAIANGTALKSGADQIRAAILQAGQRATELRANRQAYTAMLTALTGHPVGEHTALEAPPTHEVAAAHTEVANRPEMRLYRLQDEVVSARHRLLDTQKLPRLGLFAQAGVGRPGLDMLNNDFAGYYIGGVRLQWNLSFYQTHHAQRQLLEVERAGIDVQRDVFLLQTRLAAVQHQEEMNKITALMATDREVIRLHAHIKETAKRQLEAGTLTATDYLAAVTAHDLAQKALSLHQIQLWMAAQNLKTTLGY